jgi:hypothetical protein
VSILTINLALSTLISWAAARLYVVPRLAEFSPRSVLPPILLLHGFRHFGLMFLAPGATYAGLPPRLPVPAAYGHTETSWRRFLRSWRWPLSLATHSSRSR